MADCDGGVGAVLSLHQQYGQGFAHDFAATAYNHPLTGGVVPAAQQDLLDRSGGSRNKNRSPLHQPADVGRVDSINIFPGVYGFNNPMGVHLLRQGELDQKAVEARVTVDLVDQFQHLFMRRAGGECEGFAENARFLACPALVTDVDRRSGVVSDQRHRQPGGCLARPEQLFDPGLHLGADLLGQGRSIQYLRQWLHSRLAAAAEILA